MTTRQAQAQPMRALTDLTGEIHGRLTVVGETAKRGTHRMWLCACSCGGVTITRQARLRSGETTSCGCLAHFKANNPRATPAGKALSYHAAHARRRTLYGPATDHPCIDCGEEEQPHQWSYVRGCPDELMGERPAKDGKPMPYCLHPKHYAPRCVDCHKPMDRAGLGSARRLRSMLLQGSVR